MFVHKCNKDDDNNNNNNKDSNSNNNKSSNKFPVTLGQPTPLVLYYNNM